MGLLLAGCANSETRSIVSKSDLRAGGYKKIIVFIEDKNPQSSSEQVHMAVGPVVVPIHVPSGSAETAEIEQKIVNALRNAGVAATSGPAFFKGKRLSEREKASIVQKSFDAVLYVNVLVNGRTEELVEGASHDGSFISVSGETEEIDDNTLSRYVLKNDGTVYRQVPTIMTRSDLQDTQTTKQVWSAETLAKGGTLVLMSRVAEQITEQLRTDGAI